MQQNIMKKILIVDDTMANLAAITSLLSDYYRVFPVSSGAVALKFLEKQRPDLILLDVEMPEMSGIELIKIIKADNALSDIPIIFLTALEDVVSEEQAFKLGAVDYIHKPVNSTVMMQRIRIHLELQAYRHELETLVEIRTAEVMMMQQVIIELLACVNEFRDKDTGNHIKRTTGYVCAIMNKLPEMRSYHISREKYENIKKSAPLHDIGKISIPDSILLKPDHFTKEEYQIMKTHVISGIELLQNAIKEFNGPSFLDTALELVLTHHERWDGSGYPNGLAGEDIPISGRIMALADVYDALTSQRPYKPALSHQEASEIINESSGKHFDPVLVEIFMQIQDEILSISKQY